MKKQERFAGLVVLFLVFLLGINKVNAQGKPDLIITSAYITTQSESRVDYIYVIKNVGTAPANLDGPTNADHDNVTIQGFLSADTILDTHADVAAGGAILGKSPLGQLVPGQSIAGNWYSFLNVQLPYLILTIDWNNVVDESDETNNTALIQISGAAEWPMFGYDAQRTGRSPYNGPSNSDLIWSFDTGDVVTSPVIGANGTIYVGSKNGKLFAINPNGTLKWSIETGGRIIASPGISSRGEVLVCSWDRKIYAVGPDGKIVWTYETVERIDAAPVVASDGTIYISVELRLYSLTPSGNLNWVYTPNLSNLEVTITPSVGNDGTVLVPTKSLTDAGSKGGLYAVKPDGNLKWSFPLAGGAESAPAVGQDGTIYIGSFDGILYALDSDGQLRWSSRVPNSSIAIRTSSPAIGSDGTIYVGTFGGELLAFNSMGVLQWLYDSRGIMDASPIVDPNGVVYVGAHNGQLHSISAFARLNWQFQTSGWIRGSAAISRDGTIYVGSADGTLYAIGDNPTSVGHNTDANPIRFSLESNFPNPFNPQTQIRFQIPETAVVVLRIYNTVGQEIKTLANHRYTAGEYVVIWDGKDNQGLDVASGVYFYRLSAGNFTSVKKMTLLR